MCPFHNLPLKIKRKKGIVETNLIILILHKGQNICWVDLVNPNRLKIILLEEVHYLFHWKSTQYALLCFYTNRILS